MNAKTRRTRRRGALIVTLIALAGCGGGSTNGQPQLVQVGYFVDGTASTANVTLHTGTATDDRQLVGVGLPLKNREGMPGLYVTVNKGTSVSISAENAGAGGDVRCRIVADGKTISTDTKSGPHATATCHGKAGAISRQR